MKQIVSVLCIVMIMTCGVSCGNGTRKKPQKIVHNLNIQTSPLPETSYIKAIKKGDYAAALKELRPLAELGDARAQVNLGVMYSQGQGVPFDQVEAVKWIRKSAEQGYPDGQLFMGIMYGLGLGVTKDYSESNKWYFKAAEQGQPIAQYALALKYYKCNGGLNQDYKEAAKWFRKSAEQGFIDAQAYLGVMHIRGKGVPEDRVLAYMWLNLSPTNKNPEVVSLREDLEKLITPVQKEEAQKLIREWKPKK